MPTKQDLIKRIQELETELIQKNQLIIQLKRQPEGTPPVSSPSVEQESPPVTSPSVEQESPRVTTTSIEQESRISQNGTARASTAHDSPNEDIDAILEGQTKRTRVRPTTEDPEPKRSKPSKSPIETYLCGLVAPDKWSHSQQMLNLDSRPGFCRTVTAIAGRCISNVHLSTAELTSDGIEMIRAYGSLISRSKPQDDAARRINNFRRIVWLSLFVVESYCGVPLKEIHKEMRAQFYPTSSPKYLNFLLYVPYWIGSLSYELQKGSKIDEETCWGDHVDEIFFLHKFSAQLYAKLASSKQSLSDVVPVLKSAKYKKVAQPVVLPYTRQWSIPAFVKVLSPNTSTKRICEALGRHPDESDKIDLIASEYSRIIADPTCQDVQSEDNQFQIDPPTHEQTGGVVLLRNNYGPSVNDNATNSLQGESPLQYDLDHGQQHPQPPSSPRAILHGCQPNHHVSVQRSQLDPDSPSTVPIAAQALTCLSQSTTYNPVQMVADEHHGGTNATSSSHEIGTDNALFTSAFLDPPFESMHGLGFPYGANSMAPPFDNMLGLDYRYSENNMDSAFDDVHGLGYPYGENSMDSAWDDAFGFGFDFHFNYDPESGEYTAVIPTRHSEYNKVWDSPTISPSPT